nr:acyl-CoA carboxylase subunit epsilon [uncultured Actinoplanes sp.]
MNTEPLVSVVRGRPTPEELAALVTVVVARSAAVDAQPPRPALSAWARSARPSMTPASWRASGLPR